MSDNDVNSPPSGDPTPQGSSSSSPSITPEPSPSTTDPAPSPRDNPPSPGTREAEHQNLLRAVQDVVKVDPDPIVGEPRPEDATEPSDTSSPTPKEAPSQSDDLQGDPTEVELGTYKPDTRRRIEQLLAQRNEARQASERYKNDADAFAQFHDWQAANQLENDDINLLLDAGAALRRGDFRGFLERATPYIQAAQQAVGELLPADLQAQVDEGAIPWETARELGMHRINEARLQTEANTYRQHVDLTAQQQLAQQTYAAVADWEAQTKARDPDWALKQDVVERFSQSLVMSKGRPTSPQQAVAMAQEAYEEANRVLGRVRPQPAATRPSPSSNVHHANGNGSAAPEPRTLMEAAILGLQRGAQRVH
jgi:hypothetical protein